MRSTNRKRALIVSASVILLCMTVIVGMTWALFTDEKPLFNHLQAGDLSITLDRTALTKTTLNAAGYLVEEQIQAPGSKPANFTDPTNDNVFGIKDGEKIVPGSKYVATMQIANNSDVAFGYWVEIVCTNQKDGADLAKQIKVTVSVDSGLNQADFVGNGLVVKDANSGCIDELAVGEVSTFTVTVEFLDSAISGNQIEDNNLAKNQKLDFDLIVHAVQATSTPAP